MVNLSTSPSASIYTCKATSFASSLSKLGASASVYPGHFSPSLLTPPPPPTLLGGVRFPLSFPKLFIIITFNVKTRCRPSILSTSPGLDQQHYDNKDDDGGDGNVKNNNDDDEDTDGDDYDYDDDDDV